MKDKKIRKRKHTLKHCLLPTLALFSLMGVFCGIVSKMPKNNRDGTSYKGTSQGVETNVVAVSEVDADIGKTQETSETNTEYSQAQKEIPVQTALEHSAFITKSAPYFYEVSIRSMDRESLAYAKKMPSGTDALFSASTIKLFIVLTYYDYLEAGKIDGDEIYHYQEADRVEGSGVLVKQPFGTPYSLANLVNLMITESDNVATNVLIDKLDKAGGNLPEFEAVNRKIRELGYTKSKLERKMMDISNIENGKSNFISAEEASDALVRLYNGDLPHLNGMYQEDILEMMQHTENTEKIPKLINGKNGIVVYNKSGESAWRGVENDMGIITKGDQAFVLVVLTQVWNPENPDSTTYQNGAGWVAYPSVTELQENNIAFLAKAMTEIIFK